MADDILINMRVDILKAVANLRKVQKQISNTNVEDSQFLDVSKQVASAQQAVATAQEKLRKALHGSPFQGWALSVMFFGMALQRMFNTLWSSSQKVFQDVAHSVEGTVTGFDMLNGSLDYLSYAAGDALEPVAEWLSGWVDWLAELTAEHPKLTQAVAVGAAVFGGFFVILGMGVLSITGLIDGFIKIAGYISWIKASAFGKFLGTVVTAIQGAAAATWKWVTAQLALIAPWVALAALIMLAIALGISIGATWRQIIDGWIIKFKLFKNIAQDLFFGIAEWAATSIKTAVDWVNKLIQAYNGFAKAKGWATIGEIDTKGLEAAANSFRDTRVALAGEYGRLLQEGSKNEADAAKNFADGWNTIFDLVKGKTSQATSALSPNMENFMPTPQAETPDRSGVNIGTINITQGATESPQAFVQRLVVEMNKNMTRN